MAGRTALDAADAASAGEPAVAGTAESSCRRDRPAVDALGVDVAGVADAATRGGVRGAAVGTVAAAPAATLAREGADGREAVSRGTSCALAGAGGADAARWALASTASALARRRARSASSDDTAGKVDGLAEDGPALPSAATAPPRRPVPPPEDARFAETAGAVATGNAGSAGMSDSSTYWRDDFIAQPACRLTVTTGSSITVLERTRRREPPDRASDSTVTATRPGSIRDAPWVISTVAQKPSPVSPSPRETGIDRFSGRPINAAPWTWPRVKAAESSAKPSKNREAATRLNCKMIV